MSKVLVSALVGAIILFVFQALSWMALGIHAKSFKYLPEQDEVLEVMSKYMEEGYYYLPYFDPETTSEEEQMAFQKESEGKPWVMVAYHPKMEMNMAKNMGLGFLSDLLTCLIISLILVNANAPSFRLKMFFVMMIATLVMLGGPIMEANWFSTPGHYLYGMVVDIFVGYFLAGLWMSWWTGRD